MGYWLKVYTDILIDKKYFKLSDKAKSGMYELMLVVKSIENGALTGLLPDIEEISFQTRRPIEECQEIINELKSVGFIGDHQDGLLITNYVKRQQAIPDTERAKQYRKRQNDEMMESETEESQEHHEVLTVRDGENREQKENREQRTENRESTDRKKKQISFSAFISEFVNAVRVQFTNNDQPETIKDLINDYGQDNVLQAATWYGTHHPRNMGHALASINTMLSRGWNIKDEKPNNEKVLEEWLNGNKRTGNETDAEIVQASPANQTITGNA